MSFNVSYKNLKITVHTNTNNNNNNISIDNIITTTTTHSDTKNDIVTVQHEHQQGIGSTTTDGSNDQKSPTSELKPIWIEQERQATTGRNDRQLPVDTTQLKTQGMIRKNQSSSMPTTAATSNNSSKYASILNMKRSIDTKNTSTKSDITMCKKKGRTNSIINHHNDEDEGKKQKQHQAISLSSMNDSTSSIIRVPSLLLPSPAASPPLILPSPDCGNDMDPDEFLLQLVAALFPNVQLKVKSSLKLTSYFPIITEEQVLRYNVEIVQIARSNNIQALQEYYNQHGRESLNCFNRFGEGLLNMACRRGFVDMVRFLLSTEIQLPVRVRDDGGRTPMHDACWNPEPQIDICTWIIQKDPSLLLVADQRGYTPFQYARKSDWPIWRKFLVHNLDQIRILGTNEDIITTFS